LTPDRRFAVWLLAILVLASLLRGLFPAADPPWRSTVGVVWHDEGAWTHNARNKALYGAWVQDEWNPVYIAPVFTALEYGSFAAFGVGLRQARLVSEAAGVLSVLLLALGVRRLAGNRAGLIAAALLATNYVYVMYDRAAIMEALMAACIVASWWCVAEADRRPAFGAAAGLFAALAFFTKAAAAAYVGALGLLALVELTRGARAWRTNPALWVLAGLAVSFAIAAVVFVLPHWQEYQFYNWQVSVTRKPRYDIASMVQRLTWFPVLHDTFSRSWPELLLTVLGAWAVVLRWRTAAAAERLLLLWVAVGTLELLVHDVGNERRFVFLLPALVGFTALALARGSVDLDAPRARPAIWRWLAAPVVLYAAYVVAAPLVRLLFREQIFNHILRDTVRLSTGAALLAGGAALALAFRAERLRLVIRPSAAAVLLAALLGWDLYQFADWAAHRTYKNYTASVELGRVLPAGTVVQGKLANGLALDNRIRPLFIGHGFGNYATRTAREDVRYILTYTSPWLGYEGDQIKDVLDASPGWRIIMSFDVAESRYGNDTAALIDKRAGH
jgi:4-amino-4-deoxy-L-arabinose transferase-like glycosyltransferase